MILRLTRDLLITAVSLTILASPAGASEQLALVADANNLIRLHTGQEPVVVCSAGTVHAEGETCLGQKAVPRGVEKETVAVGSGGEGATFTCTTQGWRFNECTGALGYIPQASALVFGPAVAVEHSANTLLHLCTTRLNGSIGGYAVAAGDCAANLPLVNPTAPLAAAINTLRAVLGCQTGEGDQTCAERVLQAAPNGESLDGPAGSLWVAESQGLLNLNTELGEKRQEKTNVLGYTGLGVNDVNGDIWALDRQANLVSFDRLGNPLSAMPVPLGLHTVDPSDIVVDGISGNLWIAIATDLYLYDLSGNHQRTISFEAPIVSLSLERSRSKLWVALRDELRSYDVDGTLIENRSFANPNSQTAFISDIAYDREIDELWVAQTSQLKRFDETGAETFSQEGTFIGSISPDGSGGLWIATLASLRHLNALGFVDVQTVAFGDQTDRNIVDLAGDPASGSVWIVSSTQLRHLSKTGETIGDVPAGLGASGPRKLIRTALYADLDPPELQFTAPSTGTTQPTNTPTFGLSYFDLGLGVDRSALSFTVDGIARTFSCTQSDAAATCVPDIGLANGVRVVGATIADLAGNASQPATVSIVVNGVPLKVNVIAPSDGAFSNQTTLRIRGSLTKEAALTINGIAVTIDAAHAFDETVAIAEGMNVFHFVATNLFGEMDTLSLQVTRDTAAPSAPADALVDFEIHDDGTATIQGAPGSVEEGSEVDVRNVRTGEVVTVNAGAGGSFLVRLSALAGDEFQITARDRATNVSTPLTMALVPRNPASVAPALSASSNTNFTDGIEFLVSGSKPIQTGLVPGTISAIQGAVLRGRVLRRDGTALIGAVVSIKNHPAYGQTLSRVDGRYDLVVNGGGVLTVEIEKSGYIPVQRQVEAPWRDFAEVPDAVMVQWDPQATLVSLPVVNSAQVARGSAVSDDDGSRQATLIFMPGTTAAMVMPDGSTVPMQSATIRATEYTVGANGPKSMPGPLPSSSGYTYAAELSADEAVAAGARSVQFNKPVSLYIDNFLSFPVGTVIPAGWYDRNRSAWVSSVDGVVLKILSVDNGHAVIGLMDDATPATGQQLADLGITADERVRLGTTYAPGASLWRVPVTHFTPWDANLPFGPPDDANYPNQKPPARDGDVDNPDCKKGSIIECQNQVLRESIPITGTDLSLNYRSDRMPGAQHSYGFLIPLSGANLPTSLQRIELEVEMGGQSFRVTLPPQPNLSHRFMWNGLDVYGRKVVGSQNAKVSVGYVYNGVYRTPATGGNSFGRPGTGPIEGSLTRQEVTLLQKSGVSLTPWDARAAGLAGWTLSIHHSYDPRGGVLHRGDGTKTSAANLNASIATIAGIGGDFGGPGTADQTGIGGPEGLVLASDGTLFIADWDDDRILRLAADGLVTSVVGNGDYGFAGDGGPASEATLLGPLGIDLGPDGSLYIADVGNSRIRRVGPDGIISTVAGDGSGTPYPEVAIDNVLATQSPLWDPEDVVVAPDGTLFIADSYASRVRRIGTDGIITTVAGNGTYESTGDGGLAINATLDNPNAVALGPDGSLYIAEGWRVRRVTPDGIIRTVAGNGSFVSSGDGGPATQAGLGFPFDVTVAANGTLYITTNKDTVRKVTADGIISTVSGTGVDGFAGDGGPAAGAILRNPGLTATHPDGSLLLADTGNGRVRRIAGPLPGFSNSEIGVASPDGTEIYRFDRNGKHLETVDALTGAAIYTFTYNGAGYLVSITDRDGDVTAIERNGALPLAIVSGDGVRTELAVDANGYLYTATNPNGEQYVLGTSPQGLLASFAKPRGFSSTFNYDPTGRLYTDSNAAGGSSTLGRIVTSIGTQSTLTTAEGRVDTFSVEQLPWGTERRTNTSPDGSVETILSKLDGERSTTSSNGTVTTLVGSGDPRFGMQAPIPKTATVRTPGNVTLTAATTAIAINGNASHPLGLSTLTQATVINGKAFTRVYSANAGTLTTTSPLSRQSVTTLDENARIVAKQVAQFEPTEYTYDATGRLDLVTSGSGQSARSTDYAYYGAGPFTGLLQSVVNAENQTTTFDDYDLAGRIKLQTLPGGRQISYQYDPNGNVTSISPPGAPAHSFDYTVVDLSELYTPPDAANVANKVTQQSFTLDGNVSLITKPDGQTISFDYNAPGKKLSAMNTPTGSYAFTYKPASGQVENISAPGGQGLASTYDGFLLKTETESGVVSGTVGWNYNNNFRVSSQTVNGANSISFTYDDDGLIKSAGSETITRDPVHGLVSGTTLGGVVTTRTYSSFAELSSESAAYNSVQFFQESYPVRDKLGRIRERITSIGGVTTNHGYEYDAAGRLWKVSINGSLSSTYGYDANGNRESHNGTAATYDDQDRLLTYGAKTYTYTANGERLTKVDGGATTGYGYDLLGNLRTASLPNGTALEYVIDGRNRRVGKKVNGGLTQGFLYGDELEPSPSSMLPAQLSADLFTEPRRLFRTI